MILAIDIACSQCYNENVTTKDHAALLTDEMVARIQAAVMAIATGGNGFGEVVIVIEKGEPKRIQLTRDEWLVRHSR